MEIALKEQKEGSQLQAQMRSIARSIWIKRKIIRGSAEPPEYDAANYPAHLPARIHFFASFQMRRTALRACACNWLPSFRFFEAKEIAKLTLSATELQSFYDGNYAVAVLMGS